MEMVLEHDLDNSDLETIANSSSKYPFLNDLGLDQDVRRRVSLNLDGIVKGNNEIYVTPLGKSKSPEVILAEFDSVFNNKRDLMNNPLLDLEMSNRSKFGPRSIALPWKDRFDNVKKYFEGRTSVSLTLAEPTTFNGFHFNYRLRPVSIEKAVSKLKNSTNSGLPFLTRKSKVKDKVITKYAELNESPQPCILFTRTQEGGKTRDVWGYPILDTAKEMRYYVPLLEHQRTLSWRAALVGPEEVDKHVTSLLLKCNQFSDMILVSIDFSSFDSSVRPDLINQAFGYISSLFQKDYHDEINELMNRFASIPLLTPSGIFKGIHGVPSGSTFTNEVDSLVQYYCAMSSGVVKEGHFLIQGDDGVYLVHKDDVNKLLDAFERHGLKVNVDKSRIANDHCLYLQCLYHTDYLKSGSDVGGIYPVYRALNRILFQERWSNFEDFGLKGKDYYSIRTISILENCKHHPLFEELTRFIFDLDKYSLEYSKESLTKYCELLNEGPGTWGVLYNQYGDNVKGLSSFKTVQLLKSFA